jgi:hypothetical protein
MADVRAAALLAAVLLAITGCTQRPSGEHPREGTPTMSAPAVRTDPEPLTKRFPRLGDLREVHWQGSAAGADTGGVPGPTDVHIQALAVLRPETLASLTSRYDWMPAPSGWDTAVSAELRRFAPAKGAWKVSERFAADVRTTRYSGPVHLETTSGTVFLDLVGG